ncbi:MAG: DUF1003 domain-containing protein [Candidatus Paceibacterota bacterium]
MSQNNDFFSSLVPNEKREQRKEIFKSIKAKTDAERTMPEKIADWMTSNFGSMTFLLINVCIFIAWIVINIIEIETVPSFDPFPFNLLTTFVSLEAIILAIFVLISQNRSAKIADLREETQLQLDLVSEREITELIKMLIVLLEKQGIDLSKNLEIKKMILPLNEEEIEKKLEKEIL